MVLEVETNTWEVDNGSDTGLSELLRIAFLSPELVHIVIQ
jgi:hypothetical protein